MSQINLQNDNNLDTENNKKNKKKNGGFFVSDETTEEFIDREVTENSTENVQKEPLSREEIRKKNRARLKKIVAVIAVSLCGLILINFVLNSDIVKNANFGGNSEDRGTQTKLYIYPADWETDIFTNERYLELKRDVVYSPNGVEFITLEKSEYYRYGGNGLLFITDYIDTIIAGDHEKLNDMFSEEYWKTRDEDGNKREKYSAFPQQKIFNVKIVKYSYSDPKYDTAAYDDHYYIVSYNIYRNDGLFRDDIDEYSELAQMITVLLDPEGNGQIANIIDLPGYIAGHMN